MKKINEQIVGTTNKLGKILGQVNQVDGTETTIVMNPVKYCPQATKNLFTITSALSNGSKLQFVDTNNIQLAQANGTMLKLDP